MKPLPQWLERNEMPPIGGASRSDGQFFTSAMADLMSFKPGLDLDDDLLQYWSRRQWAETLSSQLDRARALDLRKYVDGFFGSSPDDSIWPRVLPQQLARDTWDVAPYAKTTDPEEVVVCERWLSAWADGAIGSDMPVHPLVSVAVATRVLAAGWGPVVAESLAGPMLGMQLLDRSKWGASVAVTTGRRVLAEVGKPSSWLAETPERWLSWSRNCAEGWRESVRQSQAQIRCWRATTGQLSGLLTGQNMMAATARNLSEGLCGFGVKPFEIGQLAAETMNHYNTAKQAVETWLGAGVLQQLTPSSQQRSRKFGVTPAWSRRLSGITEDMPPLLTEAGRAARQSRRKT